MEELRPGTVFAGRYRIERCLDTSLMAHVYVAQDTHSECDATVVLKLVLNCTDSTLRARAYLEARILTELHHPNIQKCRGIFEHSNVLYLVMDFCIGRDLSRVLDEKSPQLSVRKRFLIARDLCDILGYIHAHGIAHRDFKPDNLILTSIGDVPHVTLIDFGVARPIVDGEESIPDDGWVGTIGYVAPECICKGEMVHGEALVFADIFALGVVLAELLTGTDPFFDKKPSQIEMMMLCRMEIPVHTEDASLATWLKSIMAYAPDKRPSLLQIRAVLDELLDKLPPSSPHLVARGSRDRGVMTDPSIHPTRPGAHPTDES